MEVLVEAKDQKKGTLKGRLKTQAPEIDGCVFLKGEAKPGDLGDGPDHSRPTPMTWWVKSKGTRKDKVRIDAQSMAHSLF